MDNARNAPAQFPPRAPLRRIRPQGWVRWVFWGLRLYILAMLTLVAVGFAHGLR